MRTLLRVGVPALATLGVLVSAATGLGGAWLHGRAEGWMLIAHMAAAPVVIAAFALLGLIWGARFRLDAGSAAGSPGPSWLLASLFWLMMLAALISISTMLAAMLPLIGYNGQVRLIEIHVISGYVLLVAGALFGVVRFLERKKGSRHASSSH